MVKNQIERFLLMRLVNEGDFVFEHDVIKRHHSSKKEVVSALAELCRHSYQRFAFKGRIAYKLARR